MSPNDRTDKGEESFRRYLAGDEAAFSEVLAAYFPNLTLFVNGFVHDIPSAEDIAMDAMTELVIHPDRFGFRSSLKTWLFAVARHKALNHLRRQKRISFTPISEELTADEDSLEEEVLENDRKRRLMDAMRALPDDMRTAVHLVYLEGLSYEEAARVLKKTRKQTDNLLSGAKKRLRSMLREDETI